MVEYMMKVCRSSDEIWEPLKETAGRCVTVYMQVVLFEIIAGTAEPYLVRTQ